MTSPKTGTRLGVVAGIVCVACCALPLLIAAGLVSGGAAALLAGKMPIIEIVLVVIAATAFGLVALRKTRRSGSGDACKGERECGCTSSSSTTTG